MWSWSLLTAALLFSPELVPKYICLPIHLEENTPPAYAIHKLAQVIDDLQGGLDISCSQPDYQLFFEVDKNLGEDDFILIISDVNIQIAGGSDRSVMYGIEEFRRQLIMNDYQISKIKSVVNRTRCQVRGLQIDIEYAVRQDHHYWQDMLDQMVDLRFNTLVLETPDIGRRRLRTKDSKRSDQQQGTSDKIRQLSKERGINFYISDHTLKAISDSTKVSDEFAARAISNPLISPVPEDADFIHAVNSAVYLDQLPEAIESAQYGISLIKIRNLFVQNGVSALDQKKWRNRIADNNQIYLAGALINYMGQVVTTDRTGGIHNFIEGNWIYYSSWANIFYDPAKSSILNQGLFFDLPVCARNNLLQAYEKIQDLMALAESFLVNEGHLYDFSSFHHLDSRGKFHFISLEKLLEYQPIDLQFASIKSSEKSLIGHGTNSRQVMTSTEVADSLSRTSSEIDSLLNTIACTAELDGMKIMNMRLNALMAAYMADKIRSATKIMHYKESRKKKYKADAISYMENASEKWRAYWMLVYDHALISKDGTYGITDIMKLTEYDLSALKAIKR